MKLYICAWLCIHFKILTPVVTFKRGEEGKIKIQLTVPIGCLQLVSQCDVILAMMDQSEDQCTGNAISF